MYDIVNGLNKKYNMLIMNLATHSLFIVNNRSFINFTTKEDLLKIVKQYHCGLIHIHYYGNYSNFHSYLKFLLNSLPPHIKVIENVNNPIKPYIHKNVSQYIFVSNYSFKVQKLKLKNASVIYPGVDTKLFFPQTYLNNQIFDIGLVYRLNNDKLSKKTIDLLIKIVKLSKKPTVFHIVGDGPNFNYYLEQVKARKVRNNFRFYGFVDYHQLPNIYNNFDLFLAPVHTESYGVVVPYALAKNIPVVGMDVGALPEILNCRKYLAKDEENLVKMVLKYSNVKYLKNYDINFLNKRITTFFSKQKMLKQYKAVYKLGLN
jgi:glycosyltransferase involved in cell wall biosynthesis